MLSQANILGQIPTSGLGQIPTSVLGHFTRPLMSALVYYYCADYTLV